MHRTTWAAKRAHYKSWAFQWRLLKRRRVAITPARFDALHVLAERGRMAQGTLRRLLGVVKSTLSELLRDLELRGLVERGARTRSGRSVEISRAGKGVVDDAEAYWSQSDFEEALFERLGYSNKAQISAYLFERICRRIRLASEDVGFGRIYGWLPYYE